VINWFANFSYYHLWYNLTEKQSVVVEPAFFRLTSTVAITQPSWVKLCGCWNVTLAARSAEDHLQSGSADGQSPQHVDAVVPSSLIQDWERSHKLWFTTTVLCWPFTTTLFGENALFDALRRLFGTHYRKLFSVVTLLLCLSVGERHSSSPRLSLSLLTNMLPGPITSEITNLWRRTNLFIIIIMTMSMICLQCFDAVGWAAGRASGM